MTRTGQAAFALWTFLFAGLAFACFWDSDTLRTEAKGVPGVVEAVTGFFPVYPDEYYERRIEIARERLAADPVDLESFDNLAVSLDRLGDSTGAIEAIEPKLAMIDASDDAGDHLYRYYANLGTFHAHRWIRDGASGEDHADLEAAREHIAKAIEINPEAHFGREFVQLAVIDWLLDPMAGIEPYDDERWPRGEWPTPLSHILPDESHSWYRTDAPDSVFEGLIGLMQLGAARDSVDIIAALGLALTGKRHSSLAVMCGQRYKELVDGGAKSVHPAVRGDWDETRIDVDFFERGLRDASAVRRYYRRCRSAAEEYHAEHTSFMLMRLAEGKHPETHADFWEGEPEAAVPAMPGSTLGMLLFGTPTRKIIGILVVGAVLLIILDVSRRLRARRASVSN